METDAPPVLPERVFEITYQEFAGQQYNRDFRGKGTLTVAGGATRYVFAGKRRAMFGGAATVTFARDQVWNVTVDGRRVQFATGVGESGLKQQPFVFLCRTPEEAAEVAALLPPTKDADAVASQEFIHRLARLPAPPHAWGWVTNLVIAANVVVFVALALQGAGWFEVVDIMPYVRFGANRADATTDGQWWRLGASMFLHFGLVHLLLNMWALLQVGHLVERLFGRALYAVLYFGSGVAGSVASLLWHRETLVWSAGASGAVFGIYGALLGFMLRERQALPRTVLQPMLKSTLLFAAYNLFYGFARSGIDNAAHIGGFAAGMLLGALLALPLERSAQSTFVSRRLGLGAFVVAAILALGVTLSPRFDYRLDDEIAFERINKTPRDKELDLLHRQQSLLAEAKKDPGALSRWLTAEGIPFYSRWRDELVALRLTPDRRTARRRDALLEILRLKIGALEHLRADVARGEPDAIAVFHAAERKIAEEVGRLTAAGTK